MFLPRVLVPFWAASAEWAGSAREPWDVTWDLLKDVPGHGFSEALAGLGRSTVIQRFGAKLALVLLEVAIGERSGLAGALFGFAAEEFEAVPEKDGHVESLEETVSALRAELEAVKIALDANSRTIAALLSGQVAETAPGREPGRGAQGPREGVVADHHLAEPPNRTR